MGAGPRVRMIVGMLLASTLAACGAGSPPERQAAPAETPMPARATPTADGSEDAPAADVPEKRRRPATITLAFGGDVHLEQALADLPARRGSTIGPLSAALREADVAMVNLETAVVGPRPAVPPAAKELEDPSARYWFRAEPSALDLLARSGVDVVSVANNHGADYGVRGLRDTLRASRSGPVAVVGAGLTPRAAYTPHRVRVRGTTVAVFAADDSARESADPVWAVGPGTGPGLAAARGGAGRLLFAVRAAAARDEVVVVYLHWGDEGASCPTGGQQLLARRLAEAGADVVVGSHAHRQQGAGLLGDTYVAYGLGNLLWYHGAQADTGVLQVRLRGHEVLGDRWMPGTIPPDGGPPVALAGASARIAQTRFADLRGCTTLDPASAVDSLPAFASSVEAIGPALRRRMNATRRQAQCPVGLTDLRHLSLSYVGFDGRAHRGELVVAADVARDVVGVFRQLYRARFPIARMELIDAYGGDDDASMAANNTSAYNCRRVAGSTSWSDHASGRAIDVNPLQNPYVRGDLVSPPRGERFVAVPRGSTARVAPGVIRADDVVTRAFARIGWTWGATYADPDFQHFSA